MNLASQIGDAKQGSFLTSGRRDKDRAFRAARRHSRFVRAMRMAIPLVIVGVAAMFAGYRWLDPMRALAKLPIGADGVVVSGTKIVMRQPRLSGYTQDERPYTITARTATKDLAIPDALEMDDVRATIVTSDRGNVEITAREGFYNSKAETVRLRNNVIVTTAEYQMVLSDALVHARVGQVVSEQPVEVRMLQGTINANRFEIRNSGEVMRFERGVTLIIDREDAPADVTGNVP